MLDQEPIIAFPQPLTRDATQESLADLLAKNGEWVGVFSSENDILEIVLGRYAGSLQIGGLLLDGFDSAPFQINRRGSGSTILNHPHIVICLAIQPDAVYKLLQSSAARGRGLLARILWSMPENNVGTRNTNPTPISQEVKAWWHDTVLKLLALPKVTDYILNEEIVRYVGGEPKEVQLSSGASQVFASLIEQIEPRMAPFSEYEGIQDFAGKIPGYIARIALALHFLGGRSIEDSIDAHTMQCAEQFLPYLIDQFKNIVCNIEQSKTSAAVKRVIGWIQKYKKAKFSFRELYQNLKDKNIRFAEDLEQILFEMSEAGFISIVAEEPKQKQGRPLSRVYQVNYTQILKVFPHNPQKHVGDLGDTKKGSTNCEAGKASECALPETCKRYNCLGEEIKDTQARYMLENFAPCDFEHIPVQESKQ